MYYYKFTCKCKNPKNDVDRDMTTYKTEKVESREEYDRELAQYIEDHPDYNVVGQFMTVEEYVQDVEKQALRYVKQVYFKDKYKGTSREDFDKLMEDPDKYVEALYYFMFKEGSQGFIRRKADLDVMPVSVYERMLDSLVYSSTPAFNEVEDEIAAKYPKRK